MKYIRFIVSLNSFAVQLGNCLCHVYPSEYAYHEDPVNRTERASANCRNYPIGPIIWSEHYIHCDGTPLRLADSDIGSEQYTPTDYYVWIADERRNHQLLFIFPTIVNLTTITLHYYSDSVRGLPRLRFWAVPDDFDVWDGIISSYSYVEVAAVPPGGEPAGHRNVSVNFTIINTLKIVMHKFVSTFSFTVSEVEFFSSCKYNSLSFITVIYVTTSRIIYNSYSSKYDRQGNHYSNRGVCFHYHCQPAIIGKYRKFQYDSNDYFVILYSCYHISIIHIILHLKHSRHGNHCTDNGF